MTRVADGVGEGVAAALASGVGEGNAAAVGRGIGEGKQPLNLTD